MRFVAGLLAAIMLGSPAVAATRATLGGKVVDATGKPLAGVKVSVLRPGSDAVLTSALSGETGMYVIEGLDVGSYHIRIEPTSNELRGDTVKADVGEKGLIVNWRLARDEKAVALAIPGQVGGEEGELCSPVQIGDYEVNRCLLAGGVVAVGLAVGLGVGLSGGGDGDGQASPSQ
jgi:hypothetical protein